MQGGEITAQKQGLRLLAKLTLELEVVKEGDAGDISLLDNKALSITREFNKMVAEIVSLTDMKAFSSGHGNNHFAVKKTVAG